MSIDEIRVRVRTKTAWLSKINWVQVAGAVGTLLTTNAFGFDHATQVKVLAVTTLAQSAITVVLKTWFTNTVTPASMAPSSPMA